MRRRNPEKTPRIKGGAVIDDMPMLIGVGYSCRSTLQAGERARAGALYAAVSRGMRIRTKIR
jgi:hypothetical protein